MTSFEKILKWIRWKLDIEDEWVDERSDGFTWWAQGLAQHFRLRETNEGTGDGLREWLELDTDLVFAEGDDEARGTLLAIFINGPMGMGFARTVDDRLVLTARARLSDGKDALIGRLMAERALHHQVLAARLAALEETAWRLRPAASPHPSHGVRADVNTLLAWAQQHFLPRRLDAPAGVDLDGAAAILASTGERVEGGTAVGWIGSTHRFIVHPRRHLKDGQLQSSIFEDMVSFMVRIDAVPKSPVMGTGVVARVFMPIPKEITDRDDPPKLAKVFNEHALGHFGPTFSFGAWSVHAPWPEGEPGHWVHTTFYSTALESPSAIDHIAELAVTQGQWWMKAWGVMMYK